MSVPFPICLWLYWKNIEITEILGLPEYCLPINQPYKIWILEYKLKLFQI